MFFPQNSRNLLRSKWTAHVSRYRGNKWEDHLCWSRCWFSRCFRHQGAAAGIESFGTFGPALKIGYGQFYLEDGDF